MADIDYLGHLRADADAFTSHLADADLERPVDACPGWTVADLAVHLGAVHRWAAENVRRAGRPPDGWSRLFATIAPDDPGLLDWCKEGAAALIDILTTTDPNAAAWSWGQDKTVGFWHRRQAHETSVHRYDIDPAHTPIDARLAADGIDEYFEIMAAAASAEARGSFTLHATDADRTWHLTVADDAVHRGDDQARSDAVRIEGTANEVLLAIWRRRPVPQAWVDAVRPV